MADRKQASYSLHDYVQNNNNSLDQQGFNNADGAVLTQVSNMNFDSAGIDIHSGNSMSVSELYERVKNTPEYNSMSSDNKKLLKEMANSNRYKDMVVSNYVHDPAKNNTSGFPVGKDANTEQFAAVTISYKQNGKTTNYMSFRATDGSTDGWNEDLLMVSSKKTQAQSDSATYMNIVGRELDGDFSGGGHSKGGNDFEYGYLYCDEEVRKKIKAGYMYDSPGLQSEMIANNPYYRDLQRISKGHFICPQDSIVGQLLHENDNAVYVHSVESGFNEHDPYSWEIDPSTGEFIVTEQSEMSKYINNVLDRAVDGMDDKERAALFAFVSYILINCSDEKGLDGLGEFFANGWTNEDGSFNFNKLLDIGGVILNDWNHLSPAEKWKLIGAIGAVVTGLVATTFDYIVEKVEMWVEDMKRKIKEAIDSAIEKIKNWAKMKYDELCNFFGGIYNSIVEGLNKIKEWWNKNFNAGYKYANANPYIVINTITMKNYASQLSALSGRAKRLDSKMNSLYWHLGIDWHTISNLGRLLKAEFILDYAYRLDKCVNYLNQTASDFEKVERDISSNL